MLAQALNDPDPVLMFEHATLYNQEDDVLDEVPFQDLYQAKVMRPGTDLTIITYGGTLPKALQASEDLQRQGVSAEVIDLRCLRPLDMKTVVASVTKTHRALIVDEGWKSGSLSAEIMAHLMEQAFFELDAPVARVCSKEVPIPYAKHLEEAALPQVSEIVQEAVRLVGHHV